jgi:hypothetical protein
MALTSPAALLGDLWDQKVKLQDSGHQNLVGKFILIFKCLQVSKTSNALFPELFRPLHPPLPLSAVHSKSYTDSKGNQPVWSWFIHIRILKQAILWVTMTSKTLLQAPSDSILFWIRKLHFARTLCSSSILMSEAAKCEWVLNLEKHVLQSLPTAFLQLLTLEATSLHWVTVLCWLGMIYWAFKPTSCLLSRSMLHGPQ